MNGGQVVGIVAILAPFVFTAWVITVSMRSKERKRKATSYYEKEDEEFFQELARGIRDLERRIENLEIIFRHRDKSERNV